MPPTKKYTPHSKIEILALPDTDQNYGPDRLNTLYISYGHILEQVSVLRVFGQHKTSLEFMESYRISYGFLFFSAADLMSRPQLLAFMQGRDGWRIPIEGFHGPDAAPF